MICILIASTLLQKVYDKTIMDFDDEPMDVDLSSSSNRHIDAMDISYNESHHSLLDIKIKQEPIDMNSPEVKIKEEPIEMKPLKVKIKEEPIDNLTDKIFDSEINPVQSPTVVKRYSLQRKHDKSFSYTTLSVIFTIASLLTLLMYHIVTFECSKELDLQLLKKSLHKNIIGQPQATEDIIATLEEKSSSKILLFYGGTGVGKTLAVSLILENLYQYANIYHYTMPSFLDTFSTDLMLGITFCPTSLIVVDDLHTTDMNVKEQIEKLVEKSENLNKNITIILVFNCDTISDQYVKKCDFSFGMDLQKAFREIKALKRLIKFNSLNEEHLKKCIEKELGGRILGHEEFKNIVKNFNVSVDGCKGVYTKMKLLNIN